MPQQETATIPTSILSEKKRFALAKNSNKGVWVALGIIGAWFLVFTLSMSVRFSFDNPLTYILILLMTHLYTGLFITAHDAMHGAVSWNKRYNNFIGRLCTTLFMFNSYKILFPKHYKHHIHVGTEQDPDYHPPNPVLWYFKFLLEYVSIKQIVLAAITFNVLKLFLPTPNLLAFWIVPSFLSTLQLFIFGTYLPHYGEHEAHNRHKARSQATNHWWAFISCYFFGYHFEHHDSPQTPWWMLYKVKEQNDAIISS